MSENIIEKQEYIALLDKAVLQALEAIVRVGALLPGPAQQNALVLDACASIVASMIVGMKQQGADEAFIERTIEVHLTGIRKVIAANVGPQLAEA